MSIRDGLGRPWVRYGPNTWRFSPRAQVTDEREFEHSWFTSEMAHALVTNGFYRFPQDDPTTSFKRAVLTLPPVGNVTLAYVNHESFPLPWCTRELVHYLALPAPETL